MFEYIIGELIEKNPAYAVVTNGGVAFKVLTPLSTYEALPEKGEVKIFTELYFAGNNQDSALRLYGFATREERRLFQLLCTVQRVGPTTAIRILSGTSVADFRKAVLGENMRYLEKIKGLGTKTAQRIVLELKDPLSAWAPKTAASGGEVNDNILTDAILALVSLGYSRMAAEQTIREVSKKIGFQSSPEELVKQALKKI
jgi:Holliday junction DNA helicase RuvA